MCLRHDLPFSFCAFVFLCFVLLLSLFLMGFISSLPQLAWDKRLSCCCCCTGVQFSTYVNNMKYDSTNFASALIIWTPKLVITQNLRVHHKKDTKLKAKQEQNTTLSPCVGKQSTTVIQKIVWYNMDHRCSCICTNQFVTIAENSWALEYQNWPMHQHN
jgi:hypothetical protein